MAAKLATIVGEVTGLQQCNHPWNIPHLVKKIRGFPLKVKLFQNTATYPNSWEGLHPPRPPPPPTPLYLGGGMNLRLHPRVNYCGNERRKMPFYNLQEDGTSRPRSFVSIIVLTICFSSLHFFLLFVILAGPHIAISHFPIIMNLFCFMSVLAHSKFPQN